MVTTKALLWPILEKFPNIKLKEAQKEIPSLTKPNFYKIRRQYLGIESKPKNIPGIKKKKSIPPQNTTLAFIDDPDELLLSTAIRELNKPSPDPRWATILINCKKENINTKSEVIDKFKQLPTQALVNLLSKSLPEEY